MSSQNIILIVILILSICYGAYYGFFKILRFFLAIIFAISLSSKFSPFLSKVFPFKTFSDQLAFSAIFFISTFFIKMILKFLLNPLENFQKLKAYNRFFGAISMTFIFILILGLLYNFQNVFKQKNIYFKDSKILYAIYKFDQNFYNILPKNLKQNINNLSDLIFRDWKKVIK